MKNISTELVVSIIILIISGTTFIWNWNDRRKKKPVVQNMYNTNKNCLNVTICNNVSFNLNIKKVYKRKFWFIKKRMSIGISDANNELHSDFLAKKKLGNVFLADEKRDYFKIYLEKNEDISGKTFIFKT